MVNLTELDKLSTEFNVDGLEYYSRKCTDGTWIWTREENESTGEVKDYIDEEINNRK